MQGTPSTGTSRSNVTAVTQDTGEPALLPILQGPEAAPLEHLYRAALDALHEVMQQARTSYWQAELQAMLEDWDQMRDVSRFRAASYGLGDLIIHPTNFPALTAVQAAWLGRCLDLLRATAHICVDVVRAPDLSGFNAYQMRGRQDYHAALQEEVARARAAARGTPSEPLEFAIWQVIDHYGGYGGPQGLHRLSGSRCRVCWRRFVSPLGVADAAAGRWLRPACRARWSTGAAGSSSCVPSPVSRMPHAGRRSARCRRRLSASVRQCCSRSRRRTLPCVRTVARDATRRGCGGTS